MTVLFVTLIGGNLLLALTHAISSLSEKLIAKRGFITLWSERYYALVNCIPDPRPPPPQVVGILQSNSGAITLFLHLFLVLPPG